MSYESYRTVHDLPGLTLSNPVPDAVDDMTDVDPVSNEIRADDDYIYVATTVVAGVSVVWKRIAMAAWS